MRSGLAILVLCWSTGGVVWAQEDTGSSDSEIEDPDSRIMDVAGVESTDEASPGGPEAEEDEDGDTVAAKVRKRRKARKRTAQEEPEEEESLLVRYKDEGLGLFALVLLWLFSRKREQRVSMDKRPVRMSPVSEDELGRALYGVIKGGRMENYRALFITGNEASQILGEEAARGYLERRSMEVLKTNFEAHEQGFFGVTGYVGYVRTDDDRFSLKVRFGNDKEREVPIASLAMVGAVLRLAVPACTWEG